MPRILALTLGDRYGVGPELIAHLLAEWRPDPDLVPVVVGDRAVFEHGCAVRGVAPSVRSLEDFGGAGGDATPGFVHRPHDAPVGGPGRVSAEAGREVLATLDFAIAQARAGAIDGLVYAPLNKQAMRDAGHAGGDEAEFFSARFGAEAGEINMLGEIWTSRVTSHVPIAAVAGLITRPAVRRGIARMDGFLRSIGIPAPRLAVAALNPHAGEGGAFGREEIDIIAPAIAEARAEGIDLEGPFPADTVFPHVLKGGFHAVVTMYHDQGQIALKLLGLGRGVTVLGGLPIPVTTAGHGTAYDIAGRGTASPEGMLSAVATCRAMMGASAS